jgi:hypothetical protein
MGERTYVNVQNSRLVHIAYIYAYYEKRLGACFDDRQEWNYYKKERSVA